MARIAILRHLGGLTFDAVFQESHTSELTVTENPVETGVKVADHAYMEPRTVTISAGVSDTPVGTLTGDQFAGGSSRSTQAYKLLLELQATAEPFTVQTGLRLYRNMVVRRLSADQDKDSSGVLIFEAELREVLIVNTESVQFSARRTNAAGKTKKQAGSKTDAGEQQGGNVPVAKQSLLRKMRDGLK